MQDNHEASSDKPHSESSGVRMEQRIVADKSYTAMLTIAATVVGGLCVGAGIYGLWIASVSMQGAPWLLGIGAIVLAAVVLWGDLQGTAIRVGDAGVAIERGGEIVRRVAWFEMKEVSLNDGVIRVQTQESPWLIPVASNPTGAKLVIEEARKRIYPRLNISKSQFAALEKLAAQKSRATSQLVAIESVQITGRVCKASEQTITFEQDARLCPQCGQIYHKNHLPDRCVTCDGPLDKPVRP